MGLASLEYTYISTSSLAGGRAAGRSALKYHSLKVSQDRPPRSRLRPESSPTTLSRACILIPIVTEIFVRHIFSLLYYSHEEPSCLLVYIIGKKQRNCGKKYNTGNGYRIYNQKRTKVTMIAIPDTPTYLNHPRPRH